MNWYTELKLASFKDVAVQKIEELKSYLSQLINDQQVAQFRNDPSLLNGFRAITGILSNLSETVRMRNDFNTAQELSSKAVMQLYQICQILTQKSQNAIDFLSHQATKTFFQIEETLVALLQKAATELKPQPRA